MLGAGWAVPVPYGAPLCREQGGNKQRRAVPSSLQELPDAGLLVCLELVLFSLKNRPCSL